MPGARPARRCAGVGLVRPPSPPKPGPRRSPPAEPFPPALIEEPFCARQQPDKPARSPGRGAGAGDTGHRWSWSRRHRRTHAPDRRRHHRRSRTSRSSSTSSPAPKRFASQINGRSLFFAPARRTKAPRRRHDSLDALPTDALPGPSVIAMINNRVWFSDGSRLAGAREAPRRSGSLRPSPPWAFSDPVRGRGSTSRDSSNATASSTARRRVAAHTRPPASYPSTGRFYKRPRSINLHGSRLRPPAS